MFESNRRRTTISSSGTVTVRIRPVLLIMLVRVRAAEATLELGLAAVKQKCADSVKRLTRLGALNVDVGDPHTDDQADLDPLAKRMRAAATLVRRPTDASPVERRGVNAALTARWDIAGLSTEEVLLLVDRLRFDAAADEDAPNPPQELRQSADPEEQFRAILAQSYEPPPDDRSPKFLYIARLGDEALVEAISDAHQIAHRLAARFARAVGRQLGELTSSCSVSIAAENRVDQIHAQQQCAAQLAVSSYNLREGEFVSDDPRAAGVMISVHAVHDLE